MHRLVLSVVAALGLVAALYEVPYAQTAGRANWLTDGGDPQRTSWQRRETLITTMARKPQERPLASPGQGPALRRSAVPRFGR